MPIMQCTMDGKPGLKWGEAGTCYLHDGTMMGKEMARRKAMKQAMTMKMSQSEMKKKMAGEKMDK